jgi:hypothetical protein
VPSGGKWDEFLPLWSAGHVAGLPIAAGHCSKHSDAAGCQDDAGHWVLKSICVFPSLDHI